MPATFSQTTRALASDRPGAAVLTMVAALAILGAWSAWFVGAHVTVHEVTNGGRVEVAEAAHDVDSPLAGRVVATHLELGRAVAAGDVLIELDAETEKRRLEEEKARLASIDPELEARRGQLAAIEQSHVTEHDTTVTSLAQARARKSEAEIQARQAAVEAQRAQKLHASGAISEMELTRATSDAQRANATLEAASLEIARLSNDQRTRDVEGVGRGQALRSEIASLEGQKLRSRAAIGVLEEEIAKHTIRAAVSGRLGEIAKIGVGQFVKEGERLASIVPTGELRAIADFAPEAALGRITPGQSARMRMEAFPYVQYGTVPATVLNVGSELRDGHVRVELRLDPQPTSRIPLTHGMPGSVEVDVERTTPAHLLFRAVGRVLGTPATRKGNGE